MTPRTLYISDLDGTLLDDCSRLSEGTVALLNEAISRGALFSIATARTPATVSQIMAPIVTNLPFVVMTGSALWDKNSGLYYDIQYIDPDATRQVIDTYRECGASAFLYTLPPVETGRPKLLIYHFGPLNDIERGFMAERLHSPFKRFEVPEGGESAIPDRIEDAVLFFGMQPTEVASRVFDRLKEIPLVNPMFYHDWYGETMAEVEAFPLGATKAKAVRRLARAAGADRIVVFGDNANDISMMREADVAVAVENAIDEVKEAADIILGPNTSDAVARFILDHTP